MDPTCLCSRAGQGQWWHLHCLMGCIEPSVSSETHHGTPPYYSLGIQGQGLGPSPYSVDVCLSQQGLSVPGWACKNEWLLKKKKKAVTGDGDEQYTQRAKKQDQALCQVISTVTGLIQDLLNVSRFSNRTIFVGPKKVQARDVASWTWM